MAIGIKGKSQTQQKQPDTRKHQERPPVEHGAKVKDSLLEEDEEELDSAENAKKLGIIAAVAVVVIIAAFIIVPKIGRGSDDPIVVEEDMVYDPEDEPDDYSDEDEPDDYSEGDAEDEQTSSFVTGDNDYASGNMQITADLSDAQDFVYDLEGAEVPVDYKVRNTEYVTAHVNYVAKRAIIDQGMEMYWVDVEYKDRRYRAQCPFYYFKELDDEGICRVEIEVLNLEDGGQIISYMQIIPEDDGTE